MVVKTFTSMFHKEKDLYVAECSEGSAVCTQDCL